MSIFLKVRQGTFLKNIFNESTYLNHMIARDGKTLSPFPQCSRTGTRKALAIWLQLPVS